MCRKPLILLGLVLMGIAALSEAALQGDRPSAVESGASDTLGSEAESQAPDTQSLRQAFIRGYEQYEQGRYIEACGNLHRFLSGTTPNDDDHAWASFFFGIALKKAGFSHAAVDTLVNLVTRKPNTKIVVYSLELLEEISRTQSFDEDLLINTALCDQSYDFVEGNIADFVNYYQGEYNWEHGLFSWGDEQFGRLAEDSYYYCKFLFKKGLRELYAGRTEKAISLFKEVLGAEAATGTLKNDARKTLARLYYETGAYEEADFLYQQIDMNIIEQSQNILERAWVHYRMGNPERSMGLLYSFEAPSYRNSFTPEFYILKSFIYKDVCHYQKAMGVLSHFQDRYGGALAQVYERKGPVDNHALLLVILNKPRVKRLWKFLSLLEEEQALCDRMGDDVLSSYLQDLYTLKRDEYERLFRLRVEDEYETMANALLQFEEEAHLMEYEIGLDMYQRVSDFHYSEDKQAEAESKTGLAVYKFQGEFWNDELDHYTVSLPDKCDEAEEWDIFFK